MAASIQCDNCGAVLSEKDLFCGECGVPRPLSDDDAALLPEPSPAPAIPPPAHSAGTPGTGWRIAAIVSAILGGITCLAAVLVSLIAGLSEYESMTALENWLFSAFCCLLPIGGAGAILIGVAVTVWYKRLRKV